MILPYLKRHKFHILERKLHEHRTSSDPCHLQNITAPETTTHTVSNRSPTLIIKSAWNSNEEWTKNSKHDTLELFTISHLGDVGIRKRRWWWILIKHFKRISFIRNWTAIQFPDIILYVGFKSLKVLRGQVLLAISKSIIFSSFLKMIK